MVALNVLDKSVASLNTLATIGKGYTKYLVLKNNIATIKGPLSDFLISATEK